jgi:hypothetical protein
VILTEDWKGYTLYRNTIRNMITVAFDMLSYHSDQITPLSTVIEETRVEMHKNERWAAQIQKKLGDIEMHTIVEFMKAYYKINVKLRQLNYVPFHTITIKCLVKHAILKLIDHDESTAENWDAYYNEDGDEAHLAFENYEGDSNKENEETMIHG